MLQSHFLSRCQKIYKNTINQSANNLNTQATAFKRLELFASKSGIQPNCKLYVVKAFVLSAVSISMMLTGCTGDKAGTTRIIEQNKDEQVAAKSTVLALSMPLVGASVQLYDLTNQKVLGEAIVTTNNKDSDGNTIAKEKLSEVDKGQALVIKIPAEIDENALVLSTLSLGAGKTYFDPILGRDVRLSEEKTLYALTTGKDLSVTPSAFSTLVTYRTLARLGWFFENESLPSKEQLSQLIYRDDAELVLAQYAMSLNEVADTFLYTAFPAAISSYDELKQLSSESSAAKSKLLSWVQLIAQLRVYAEAFNVTAPFFDMANDLSVDFFDGDIDGRTFWGVKPKLTKRLVNAPKNTNPDNNPVSQITDYKFDALYDVQKPVLSDFEAKVLEQLKNTLSDIGISSSDESYADLVAFFSVDDLGKNEQQVRTNNDGDPLTYNDLRLGLATPFMGVGDKTFAFGLSGSLDSLSFIDGQPNTNYSGVGAIVGSYNSGGCTLTIGTNGIIRLTQGVNRFDTLLDRASNDNISRIDQQNYVLKSFALNDDGKSYRLIQVNVKQGVVSSASTSHIDSKDTTDSNPEFDCTFSS